MKLLQILALPLSLALLATPAFAQPDEQPRPQQPQPYEETPSERTPADRPQQPQAQKHLDGVPQEARDTIQRHVGDGQIRSVKREQRDGGMTYKVKFRGQDGDSHMLKVDAQGELLELKRDTKRDDR
jgi:hypothetical protein